jgi:hypothetical protein
VVARLADYEPPLDIDQFFENEIGLGTLPRGWPDVDID